MQNLLCAPGQAPALSDIPGPTPVIPTHSQMPEPVCQQDPVPGELRHLEFIWT